MRHDRNGLACGYSPRTQRKRGDVSVPIYETTKTIYGVAHALLRGLLSFGRFSSLLQDRHTPMVDRMTHFVAQERRLLSSSSYLLGQEKQKLCLTKRVDITIHQRKGDRRYVGGLLSMKRRLRSSVKLLQKTPNLVRRRAFIDSGVQAYTHRIFDNWNARQGFFNSVVRTELEIDWRKGRPKQEISLTIYWKTKPTTLGMVCCLSCVTVGSAGHVLMIEDQMASVVWRRRQLHERCGHLSEQEKRMLFWIVKASLQMHLWKGAPLVAPASTILRNPDRQLRAISMKHSEYIIDVFRTMAAEYMSSHLASLAARQSGWSCKVVSEAQPMICEDVVGQLFSPCQRMRKRPSVNVMNYHSFVDALTHTALWTRRPYKKGHVPPFAPCQISTVMEPLHRNQ